MYGKTGPSKWRISIFSNAPGLYSDTVPLTWLCTFLPFIVCPFNLSLFVVFLPSRMQLCSYKTGQKQTNKQKQETYQEN